MRRSVIHRTILFTCFFHTFSESIYFFVYQTGKVNPEVRPIMEVTFATQKLMKLCNAMEKLRGKYGNRQAAVIMRRLVDLAAVENLEAMRLLPGRCHELSANFKGHLALDLVQPDRLVFKPNHEDRPQLASGALDWGNVTRVLIVAIGDYHD